MSRAIKPISLTVTLITLCCALTACHGSRGMDAFVMPEEFDASRQYELTFWAKNDTNKNQTRIYEQAIRDFESLYPNIKISLRLYTDYGKIYNDVITNIATNTTPNICITYPDHIATYLTGTNVVAPLDELMADSRYGLGGSELKFTTPKTEQLVSKYLEECRIGEHYYALPFMRSTEACYINKDYVEKLGFTLPDTLTWDFIWQVSEAATEKNADDTYKVNGQKVMIPFIYKSTDNMMITLLRQSGAEYSNGEGNALMFNDQTKELLYTVAEHTKSGAFSTFKISGYPANFLNAGQCIFAIDSTAGSTWNTGASGSSWGTVRTAVSGAERMRIQQGGQRRGACIVAVLPISAHRRRADSLFRNRGLRSRYRYGKEQCGLFGLPFKQRQRCRAL